MKYRIKNSIIGWLWESYLLVIFAYNTLLMHLSNFPLKKLYSPNNVKIRRTIAHLRLTNNNVICNYVSNSTVTQQCKTKIMQQCIPYIPKRVLFQPNWCLYIGQSTIFHLVFFKAIHEWKALMLEWNLIVVHSHWVTWRKQSHVKSCSFANLTEEAAKAVIPKMFLFFKVLI